eukprot:2094513-Amphidinium_carterae.1
MNATFDPKWPPFEGYCSHSGCRLPQVARVRWHSWEVWKAHSNSCQVSLQGLAALATKIQQKDVPLRTPPRVF